MEQLDLRLGFAFCPIGFFLESESLGLGPTRTHSGWPGDSDPFSPPRAGARRAAAVDRHSGPGGRANFDCHQYHLSLEMQLEQLSNLKRSLGPGPARRESITHQKSYRNCFTKSYKKKESRSIALHVTCEN